MKDKLLRRIRADAMLTRGDTVFCALSGGADSVAMTHALWSLQEALGVTVRACHFNHRLRGDASDGDEAFCRDFCNSLGLELTVGAADVRAYAAAHGESIEEAARHCRYAFFETLSGKVATAHNASDAAETVLLNLVRGTGLKGLCGIPPVRGKLIRPLLTVSRAEILDYLNEHGLSYREDATNAEDDCVRNRIRHGVLPLLNAENPALLETVGRMTETLRQDEAYLDAEAEKLLQKRGDGYEIAPLKSAPAPLRKRAIRKLLQDVPKRTAAHIDAVDALLFSDNPSASVSLPQLTVRRAYGLLVLGSEAPTFEAAHLPCPGAVTLTNGMRIVCAEEGNGLTLPRRLLAGGVTVRPRRQGDAMRLNVGTQTLKKLMIDRKIPAQLRDSIPVFEKDGTVLAVWGVGENLDCLPVRGEPTYTIQVTEKEAPE